MLRSSLSFRLALAYVGLFAASVVLIAALTYWVTIRMPLTAAETQVRREASELADAYVREGRDALVRRLEGRMRDPDPKRAFHALILPGGVVASANLPSWPVKPTSGWLRIEADIYADGDENDHEALTIDRTFDDGGRLLVGRDIESIDDAEEMLQSAAAWVIGSTFILGLCGGALMSRVIGRRIESISEAARGVMEGNLSGRVPMFGSGDDFDRLAEVLNRMLSRIESLVESVRRVSDSVAHELRTPLTRLHATLEDLAKAQDDARPQLISDAIAEAEQLTIVFDAVLRISRIESGRHPREPKAVDVSSLLTDAAELYAPAAEAREQRLEAAIEPGLCVSGDRDLLFQAMCNLLDNAVKYAPEEGRIRLSGKRSGPQVVIVVADDGPGIAEQHRGRVTERFFRINSTASTEGAGLGLSLVAAIVDHHGSTLEFADSDPGLKAIWTLPSCDAA
jgi:signal transduction histidine kinase